jgi:hypothetical protein
MLPFEAQLHIKTLTFYVNLLRRPESVEAAVIQRQISMKSPDANTWVTNVQALLSSYNLPTSSQLTKELPSKRAWKFMVRSAVTCEWTKRLKEEAREKTTLSYLNIESCSLQKVHTVWDTGATDPLTIVKAANKAKMLVQRYPLYSSRTSGRNYGRDCPLCEDSKESMTHFLLYCPTLERARMPYINTLKLLSAQHDVDITAMDDDTLCELILDTSDIPFPESEAAKICTLTRDWCFKLHHSRSVLLGAGASYTRRSRGNAEPLKNPRHRLKSGTSKPQ